MENLSAVELHQRIKEATEELIARETEEAKLMKTVKRKAEVGERILIVNANTHFVGYENGDIFTVRQVRDGGVMVNEMEEALHDLEYEVIVENQSFDFVKEVSNLLPETNEMYPQEDAKAFTDCARCNDEIMGGQDFIEGDSYDFCSDYCYIMQSIEDGIIERKVAGER